MNIDKQKQKLSREKESIEKDLNSLGRKLDNKRDWIIVPDGRTEEFMDTLDEANLTEEFTEKIAVLNVLEQRHEQVLRALRAIENATYGICEIEGCQISEERLEVNPSATTCIKHAK